MQRADGVRGALDRRHFLKAAGLAAAAGTAVPALAETIDLPLNGGYGTRPLTDAFPQKGRMVLQRTRAPLLETPFEVFDKSVFTPNDQFFVRWHWAEIPQEIDAETFRLAVRGHVDKPLSLSLTELMALPHVDIAAVNQCSGNSRGLFAPRVPGGQWGNGAMGNARWTGVPLKAVLERAGVKAGAVAVRFNGLDQPTVPEGPDFIKALALDHANDGEVLVAFAMNGEQLPLLNGFPLRLVVPGWYSTYWVKMLNDIEVLDKPDENFWMKTAYLIPDTPGANIKPGETAKMVPINRMVPRSFVTNLKPGDKVKVGSSTLVRGIAFGGDTGVKTVEFSSDGGKTWTPTQLGKDEGKYSFRQWQTDFTPAQKGAHALMVRCTNANAVQQPASPTWNPGGFMLNVVQSIHVVAA